MTAREAVGKAMSAGGPFWGLVYAVSALALAHIETAEFTKPFTETSMDMMKRQLAMAEAAEKERF